MKITELNVQNYRTLEDVQLRFSESFTAICGPNDCGKTNVIRVIRALMREHEPYFYREVEELSAKDNYPKWKHADAGEKAIRLTLAIAADKDFDVGLYQFIVKHLALEDQPQVLLFGMSVTYLAEKPEPQVTVKIGSKTFDGLVLNKFSRRYVPLEPFCFTIPRGRNHVTPVLACRGC